MNTHLLVLQLMAAQGILGAFDTLYHHELTEALPQRNTARLELAIHSARAIIYSILFVGLSAWTWNGLWALVLVALFGIEIILTLWDFVIEDKTRLLPATERVIHTILAINGGAFIALLALNIPEWYSGPSTLIWNPHGFLSIFLTLCGVGVGLSGIRDGFAAYSIGINEKRERNIQAIKFSDNSETVLVTGATGFIGKRLVKALLTDGKQVTILTRNPKHSAWMFDGKVKCISSMDDLPISYPIDVIINLAGARILGWRWSEKRKNILHKSRINLTKSIVEWIEKAKQKPKLLLSASAIGFYGIQKPGDETRLTENSPSSSIFMSQLCQDWEAAAQRAQEYGVKVKCMRFGLVLGQQGALPMLMLPIKLGLGGSLGSGNQWVSWIHVYDLVRAISYLWHLNSHDDSETKKQDTYNFTAPESVKQKQFSQIAAQVIHRPCLLPTPGFPMRLLLGEQSDLILEGQRVEPTRLQAEGFKFTYPTLQKALKSLY